MRVIVTSERRTREVAGTLFGNAPRVVVINGVSLEAALAPHMLYVNNEDKPGLIGGLGKLLGDAGVNIANFHLGRGPEGEDAVALIEVDQEITPELMQAIKALASVKQVNLLAFS